MKNLRTFFGIVDHHTVGVTLFALIATFLASRWGLAADIPTTLIGVAVVFPIVFSIQGAYVRREEALKSLSSLKAHAAAIYFAHRDWPEVPDRAEDARAALQELLKRLTRFLKGEDEDASGVYDQFSLVSRLAEGLRGDGLSPSEVSRVNQYLRELMKEFELLRNIHSYRTPVPLRAYSHIFLNIFPILFAPYFAYLNLTQHPSVGYMVAVLYSVVLVSLDNIQEHLEDPFDAVGVDDVRLDEAIQFVGALAPEEA
jgi:predicted membrane chloride channel (bestrophin family)